MNTRVADCHRPHSPFRRINLTSRALCAAMLIAFSSSTASAAVIYSQGGSVNEGLVSDPSRASYAWDNFQLLTTDTVRTVTWSGLYGFAGTAETDDFTLTFQTDVSDSPALVLQTFILGSGVTRTATGTSFLGLPIYNYSASLGTGITLSGGTTYWLSITNNTALDINDDWYWASSFGGPAYKVSALGGISRPQVTPLFTLNNAATTSVPNPVPEPASMLLLGTGLLGAGVRRWRQKRA